MRGLTDRSLCLSFDVEEFDLPADLGLAADPGACRRVARQGAERLARWCRERPGTVTCFVTAEFARNNPDLTSLLRQAGCELGCHGARHADRYDALDPLALRDRLTRARQEIEALGEAPVRGHRSPRFCAVDPVTLAGAGFAYDSSVHPTWVPGRYNMLGAPLEPHRAGPIMEVPATVVPGLRLPLSWIWFRAWPEPLLRGLTALAARRLDPVCLYFHSWELADLQAEVPGLPGLVARGCGEPLLRRLERWQQPLVDRGFAPRTILCYLERSRLL